MSNPAKGSGAPKRYSAEFKTEAVQLVLDGGLRKAEVARKLGVTATTLSEWIKNLAPEGRLEEKDLKAEVKRLAEENRQLKMERDILKKATAFFASGK